MADALKCVFSLSDAAIQLCESAKNPSLKLPFPLHICGQSPKMRAMAQSHAHNHANTPCSPQEAEAFLTEAETLVEQQGRN